MSKKEMRVLHAAVSMNPSVGVVKQMEWEQQAADALGLPWRVVLQTPKKVNSPVVVRCPDLPKNNLRKYIALRRGFYQWLRQVAEDFDLILLRHSVHDIFEAMAAKEMGKKIFTVHHTLEMPELRGGGFSGEIKALLEDQIGRYTLAHCSGIVGVTEEILLFEQIRLGEGSDQPGFVYPNGIMCSSELVEDKRGATPELIFVAAHFASWHGLDLFIEAVERNSSPCLIHIVGDVPESLSVRCLRDARFKLHGLLDSNSIKKLMQSAWCGLSSFALFRQNMQEACTLKVREYLDAGLPIYAGHRDSGLPNEFPYYRNGNLDLNDILDFSRWCRNIAREDVKIAAEKYISKKSLLWKLYKEISDHNLRDVSPRCAM